MNRLNHFFALSAMAFMPLVMQAQEGRHYEDRVHHDSHEWNSNENQAYHRYLTENHKKDRDFEKTSKRDQSAYWNWRHAHMEGDHH